MKIGEWLKQHNITAPAILLFLALAAQVPHAMTVFVRVAPHTVAWEVWLSAAGGAVYAIALEGATAFFVWRSHKKWAAGFAVFSVLHNVAYYMPPEWTIVVYGATLLWRNILGSVLISVSLPLAIAAFSHVQSQHAPAQQAQGEDAANGATPAQQPSAPTITQPAPVALKPVAATPAPTPAPVLRKVDGATDTELAAQLGVTRQAVASMRKRGTLTARIARDLPELAPVHTNGFNAQ